MQGFAFDTMKTCELDIELISTMKGNSVATAIHSCFFNTHVDSSNRAECTYILENKVKCSHGTIWMMF